MKYSAKKTWKITVTWWNKWKYKIWYKWSNSLSSNIPRKIPSISSLTTLSASAILSYKMFGTRFGHMTKIKFFPSHLSGTIGSNNRTTDHTHFLPTIISLMTEKYICSVLLHALYHVCSFLFFQVCALWTKAYCQYLGVKHARLHLIKRTCKYKRMSQNNTCDEKLLSFG